MRKLNMFSLIALCAAAFGCAPVPTVMTPNPALQTPIMLGSIPSNVGSCDEVVGENKGNCVIHVKADPKGDDSCTITLVNKNGAEIKDLDLLSLTNATGNLVYWRIINSVGYEFTDDGIAFVDNNRPRMFTNGKRLNATEFQWRRNNKKVRRVNGYVITVTKPASATDAERECELDPWIRNRLN